MQYIYNFNNKLDLYQLMKTNSFDTNLRSKNKTPPTTNIKSNYSLSSPKDSLGQRTKQPTQDNPNINKKLHFKDEPLSSIREAKEILRQSQRRISTITMADLFKQNIQNRDFRESSYTKIFNSAIQTQELQLLHNEHRIEIQKLLLEISRLHDVIYEIERVKKYELQRLKQQYEQMTYLHLSNVKQTQNSQLQILEIQLKKTKDALEQKTAQFQQVERSGNKERQLLKNENETLRNNLKEVVNKKNQQLYQIQSENEQKLKHMNKMTDNAIEEMKESCDREIRRIQRQLKQKEELSEKIKSNYQETNEKNNRLEERIQLQRIQLEDRLQVYIREGNNRYEKLMEHVNHLLDEQAQNYGEKEQMFKQIFQSQIRNLMNVIKLKGEQNNRMRTQLQTERFQFKLLKQNVEEQNKYLKDVIKSIKSKSLKQIQQLKVRMALLHQNDLKELVKLYETKIQCLNQELIRQCNETERLRKYMHVQTHRWYENKKNYEEHASKLTVEILRLKNGLGNIEKDMKQRLQNQRSAMLLTSKSLIRGVELKNTNVKFYEDELRKLRMTIDKTDHDSHELQEYLKDEIKNLQEQVKRLIESNKKNEVETHKMEQEYIKIVAEKDNQIKRLNKLARQLIDQSNDDQGQQLKSLRKNHQQIIQQLQQKSDKVKELNTRIEKLERDLQECKIENEQLYLENQINHEQAKGQYERIANSNMKSLKQFYERRIEQLELDKKELKSKESADQANIAQIVRKYQMLEECMRKMVKQAEKRTRLQERIMNLGMDNNLVKNKADLFYSQQ